MMKIFVLIKQVPDTETKIRITGDQNSIEKNDIKWIINPYDEFAIEEALRIKEKTKDATVSALSLGPDRCIEALRTAVAMGADHALHIKTTETELTDSFLVGKALATVLQKEKADLVFSGKQSIDDGQSAVFGITAELYGVPSVFPVTKTELSTDQKTIKIEKEVEGGMKEIIEVTLPCLLALDKGINTPRYASLPGIMKAKKKEITPFSFSDLGLNQETYRVKEAQYQLPAERKAGKKLTGDINTQVKELVRLLREEAKVI